MGDDVVHIIEPTARSVFGHHYFYCEKAKDTLADRGFRTMSYFAAEGLRDKELRDRARHEKFPFRFRYARAFERVYGGVIQDGDPAVRRALRAAKDAIANVLSDQSIESQNQINRLQFDLDSWTSQYPLSGAEAATLETTSREIGELADFLRVNCAADRNILFLPTAEYFLLRALLANVGQLQGTVDQIHLRLWNFLSFEKMGADCSLLAVELDRACAALGISVFLYAEVLWGCDRLAALSGKPAGYMDVNAFTPVRIRRAAEHGVPEAAGAAPMRIFFPGSYRRFPDKGLAFFRDLFRAGELPQDVEVTLQEPDFAVIGADPARARAMRGVRILPRILPPATYDAEFARADIICLPYDGVTWPDVYRGSGVILDAFMAVKPVMIEVGSPLVRYGEHFDIIQMQGYGGFCRALEAIDRSRENRRAAENCRKYTELIAKNDFFANLAAGRPSPQAAGPGAKRPIAPARTGAVRAPKITQS
jgi:hypothetical protein